LLFSYTGVRRTLNPPLW